MSLVPPELQAEVRWSNLNHRAMLSTHADMPWSQKMDDKLVLIVTQSTPSDDRFPVGVNCALRIVLVFSSTEKKPLLTTLYAIE